MNAEHLVVLLVASAPALALLAGSLWAHARSRNPFRPALHRRWWPRALTAAEHAAHLAVRRPLRAHFSKPPTPEPHGQEKNQT